MFAGLAVSAAVDLLSLLQTEKSKTGGTGASQTSFSVPDQGAGETTATQSSAGTTSGQNGISPDALNTLLSAQGQSQANGVNQKKRSISVLVDLLQSSQDGSVKKSDFAKALGSDDDIKASEMFDRIDENHDSSVNVAEMTNFLETYRRNAEAAGTASKRRTLAVAA